MSQVKVNLDDLRTALARVLEQVQQDLGRDIDLDADEYWEIPGGVAYRVTEKPADQLTVGRLSDDAETMRQMVKPNYDISSWHDLAHLCGVLRRIALLAEP
jgi:hypothetical protein